MPNIGAPELIIILVIALLVLGPGKLPEVGASLGKSIKEFRKASTDLQELVKVDVDTSPLPAAAPVAAAAVAPAGRTGGCRARASGARHRGVSGARAGRLWPVSLVSPGPCGVRHRLDHGRELAGRPRPDHGRRRRPARAGCQRRSRDARSRTGDPTCRSARR